MKNSKHKGNPNIHLHGFKKGNQLGTLGKGIPKIGNFTDSTSYERITSLLDQIPDEIFLEKLENLDDTNFCFLYLKLVEMKLGFEQKLQEIEFKKELNQSTNQDTNDTDIVSIKLVKGNQSN